MPNDSSANDILELAIRFAQRMESAGFDYLLGGSFASSVHGEPRATNDLDFVVAVDRAALPRYSRRS